MIHKKTAMKIARTSGKRELEYFAATGVLRKECLQEVQELEETAQATANGTKLERVVFQNIRMLREYVQLHLR